MGNPQKGLRIGKYRITPLGLITLGVLLLIIIGVIVLAVVNPFGSDNPKTPAAVTTAAPDELAATASPTPTPTKAPDPRSATIRSLGEIAMQLNLLSSAVTENTFDFSDMFTYISDVMGDADYTVADVDGTLGGTADPTGSGSTMITPPSLIGVLKDCGVDMLMLANDHALDGGFAEQQATIQNCVSAGMDYVGAATSEAEKQTPVIKKINGINVAFLAYTESLGGKESLVEPEATLYGVNLVTRSNAPSDVRAARAAGADVVICYMNWGEMFNQRTTETQQQIARVLVNAGVDVIIGYNPHVVQRAVWLEGAPGADGSVHRTLCLGATGNFLSDQRAKYADSGIIFQFTIQETGPATNQFTITSPVYIPTYVWREETEEEGKYTYHTMAAGQWLTPNSEPEGMSYSEAARMREVWAEIQTIMGSDVASVSAD